MRLREICRLSMTLILTLQSLSVSAQNNLNYGKDKDSSIFSKPLKIEATVKTERAPRSEQKGDTLVFNAASYQVIDNADSERLISKMPGIAVTETGVEANGKDVARILIDGQEFFGNDVLSALRNVPAELVKQIEVINKLSDAAQLSGVDDGEGYTAINIVTKRKKGSGLTTGRIYGNYGLSDRAEQRHNYIAGGNATHFSDKRTISIIGMSNNINKFNFTSSDIVSGSTGLDASGGNTFKVKALSGISSVHSLGVNYTSKNANLTYFFNDISNRNKPVSDKYTMTSTEDKELYTHSINDYWAKNMTHKIDGKITWSPLPKHTFIIRPNFTFEDMANGRNLHARYSYVFTDQDPKFVRKQNSRGDNDRWTIRAGGNINYRYRFNKRKRSLGIQGRYMYYQYNAFDQSWEYKWTKEDADSTDIESANSFTIQNRDRVTRQHQATGSVSFTEPLNRRASLTGEYQYMMTNTTGTNLIFPFVNGEYATEPKERVSAINRSIFHHHRTTARFQYGYKKLSVTAALTYQNTRFEGRTTLPAVGSNYRSYHHPLYVLIANLPFNKSNTLRIEARGRTQNPGNTMLQDVVDRSSTSNVRAGNPDIDPAYLNTAEINYIHTNRKAGTTLSIYASYTGSENYFCDSLVINNPDFIVMTDDNGKPIKLGKDNQFVKPINMPGYHKLNAKIRFAFPIDFLRSNFNLGAQTSIQRLPGMINDESVPINRNWFQISGKLDSNISKKIDFTVGYLARYYMNQYNGKFGSIANNYLTHRLDAQLKWILPYDFTFTGAFVFTKNKSTQGLYDDNRYFCDIFIGKRFLKNKRLEVSVGVNDLLDNNKTVPWHTITSTGRQDGEHIGIGRYFSLQCIWHFRQGTRPKKVIKHEPL